MDRCDDLTPTPPLPLQATQDSLQLVNDLGHGDATPLHTTTLVSHQGVAILMATGFFLSISNINHIFSTFDFFCFDFWATLVRVSPCLKFAFGTDSLERDSPTGPLFFSQRPNPLVFLHDPVVLFCSFFLHPLYLNQIHLFVFETASVLKYTPVLYQHLVVYD
jgi:hypothetical protein